MEVSNYPLFQYPPYCLALASRMAEVAACLSVWICCTSTTPFRIPSSALLAQQMTTDRRLPFVTTLHGTDITLVGVDRSYFPITKFSIEKSDGVTAISDHLQKRDRGRLRSRQPHPRDSQFRQLRPLPARSPAAAHEAKSVDPRVQFQAREARARLHSNSA